MGYQDQRVPGTVLRGTKGCVWCYAYLLRRARYSRCVLCYQVKVSLRVECEVKSAYLGFLLHVYLGTKLVQVQIPAVARAVPAASHSTVAYGGTNPVLTSVILRYQLRDQIRQHGNGFWDLPEEEVEEAEGGGQLRYLPTLSDPATSLRCLSAYSVCRRYLPTLSA